MGAVTWGVCSKGQTVTVFCFGCRKVFSLHAPMADARELKMAAEASHECTKDDCGGSPEHNQTHNGHGPIGRWDEY